MKCNRCGVEVTPGSEVFRDRDHRDGRRVLLCHRCVSWLPKLREVGLALAFAALAACAGYTDPWPWLLGGSAAAFLLALAFLVLVRRYS